MKTRLLPVFRIILLCTSFCLLTPCEARGGGGHAGGGFRGGMGGGFDRGFDRGFGDRGFGDRGFGDRGFGDRGFGDRGFGDDSLRRDDGPLNRVSESDLRAGADKVWDNRNDGLASDGLNFGMRDGAITRNLSPAYLTGRGSDLRNAFNRYDIFRNGYWNRYPGSWWYRGWGDYYPWGYVGWGDLAGYWGIPAVDAPTDYDYGDNIYYQNDSVYYGSQPVATAADYYQQAQALATTPGPAVISGGQPTNTGPATSWKPLGVYALSQNGEPSTTMFQLAVNKEGVLRGNYFNSLTDENKPIRGKVDKKTMRAAWIVEGNTKVVYEAGLSNLLHPQCSALVHKGKDTTEQWIMVKIDQKTNSANSNKSVGEKISWKQ